MDVLLNLIDAVGSSGFAAIAFAMLWYDMRELRKAHSDEVATLSQTIKDNTTVLAEIKGYLMRGWDYENENDCD